MPLFPSLTDRDGPMSSMAALHPEAGDAFGALAQHVLRGDSPLSTAQREMIAAYVSGLNACRFCHGNHTAVAERLGVAPGLVDALLDDPERADVDPAMRPLLAFVRKLTETPARMTQEDVDRVFAAGWSERALAHATLVCATFNFVNRWVEAAGLSWSEAGFERAGRYLAEHGYGPPDGDA